MSSLKASRRRSRRLELEALEDRLAPAVASLREGPVAVTGGNRAKDDSGIDGYTPAQIRTAYGLNNISLDGTGQTIAILGLYDNPYLGPDLDTFDQQFGATASGKTLYQQYGPASSFLTKYNENGQTSPLPGPDPSDNTESEEVLDVEWAHAIAPGAKIVFVEGSTDSDADAEKATITAAGLPGVTVFTTSYSDTSESSDELSQDSEYQDPNVTYFAASGDNGPFDTGTPAFSPYVVSVGGTTLNLAADGTYESETGWGNGKHTRFDGGSGGGVSLYEPEPAYQQSVQDTGARTIPDVAFDADPNTGVAVVDSYDDPIDPWTVLGGTSLAAPAWAAMTAIANEGRAQAGEQPLDHSDPMQTLEALYSLPDADYHDNLGGNNDTGTADLLNVARYNEVTGLGSPVAPNIISDLIAYSGPVSLGSTSLPGGTVNMAYDQPITASGGTGAKTLTYSITSGSIPAGLSFQASTSELDISGTPTADGSVSFTVTATDSTGLTATESYTLAIGGVVVITTAPQSLTAGSASAVIEVQLEDANGDVVPAGSNGVTFSLASSSSGGKFLDMNGNPLSSPTITVANGPATASFEYEDTAVGTPTVTVSAEGLSATQQETIAPAAASALAVTTVSRKTAAGQPSSIITVELQDPFGNVVAAGSSGVSVNLGSSSSAASFLDSSGNPLSSPVIDIDSGSTSASFEYQDTVAGTPTLTLTATGLTAAKQQETITALAASTLVVTAPGQVIVNGAFKVGITAEDRYGNIDPTFSRSVSVSLLDAPAGVKLSGPLLETMKGGVGTLSGLSINRGGGPYTLLVAGSGSGPSGDSGGIIVSQTTHFVLGGTPAHLTAGGSFTLSIRAMNASNHVDTTYLGTVVLASNDPQVVFAGGDMVTFTASEDGVAQVNVTLKTAGKDTISAADVTRASTDGVSPAVAVAAASLVGLKVSSASTAVADNAFSFKVSAVDTYGNPVSSYRGTVVFASTPPAAKLPAQYSFTSADPGSHTFTATLLDTGSYTLTADDLANGFSASDPGISVVSPATHLGVSVSNTKTTAGQLFTITVTPLTSQKMTDTLFTDVLHFKSSDPNAGLPADVAFTPNGTGAETFTVALVTAGNQTITVTDVTRPAITGTSPAVSVVAGSLAGLEVTGSATAVAGSNYRFTVTAVDYYGNKVSGYRGTVYFGSDNAAQLPMPYTFTGADHGSHTFTAVPFYVGPITLTATDYGNDLGGSDENINVVSPATHLLISVQTTKTSAGASFTITVTPLTKQNIIDTQFTDFLHFTSSDPNADLPADAQFSGDPVTGTETFTVTLNTPGNQTITVSDLTRPTISGVSPTITITANSNKIRAPGPRIRRGGRT